MSGLVDNNRACVNKKHGDKIICKKKKKFYQLQTSEQPIKHLCAKQPLLACGTYPLLACGTKAAENKNLEDTTETSRFAAWVVLTEHKNEKSDL